MRRSIYFLLFALPFIGASLGFAQSSVTPDTPKSQETGQAAATELTPRPYRFPRTSTSVAAIFEPGAKTAIGDVGGRTLLSPVGNWVYHIHNVDIEAVRACRADVAVIDYSVDGTHARAFTRAEVESMRKKPDGRSMKMIAYMSIGEAEDYRDLYFKKEWLKGNRPSWLGPLNPNWAGNFNVRYWDPAWQKIIFGSPGAYLDTLIANGFDGTYLDIVDGFEFWQEAGNPDGPRRTAAADMVDFVTALARYAWSKQPGFLVIPQNGERLLESPAYVAHISAIATEDVFFKGVRAPAGETRRDDVERQEAADTRRRLAHLDLALAQRVPVISVEYLMDQPEDRLLASGVATQMRKRGLVPHFSVRQLGALQCAMAN